MMQSEVLKQKIAEKDARIADLQRRLVAIEANAPNQVMDAQRQYDELARKNRDLVIQSQSKCIWAEYFVSFMTHYNAH